MSTLQLNGMLAGSVPVPHLVLCRGPFRLPELFVCDMMSGGLFLPTLSRNARQLLYMSPQSTRLTPESRYSP